MKIIEPPRKQGLYDPQYENDACGVGFLVNIKGKKSNQIIRQALHPYPEDLVIVTKVGARRPPDGSWLPAQRPEDLTAGCNVLLNAVLDRSNAVLPERA